MMAMASVEFWMPVSKAMVLIWRRGSRKRSAKLAPKSIPRGSIEKAEIHTCQPAKDPITPFFYYCSNVTAILYNIQSIEQETTAETVKLGILDCSLD